MLRRLVRLADAMAVRAAVHSSRCCRLGGGFGRGAARPPLHWNPHGTLDSFGPMCTRTGSAHASARHAVPPSGRLFPCLFVCLFVCLFSARDAAGRRAVGLRGRVPVRHGTSEEERPLHGKRERAGLSGICSWAGGMGAGPTSVEPGCDRVEVGAGSPVGKDGPAHVRRFSAAAVDGWIGGWMDKIDGRMDEYGRWIDG